MIVTCKIDADGDVWTDDALLSMVGQTPRITEGLDASRIYGRGTVRAATRDLDGGVLLQVEIDERFEDEIVNRFGLHVDPTAPTDASPVMAGFSAGNYSHDPLQDRRTLRGPITLYQFSPAAVAGPRAAARMGDGRVRITDTIGWEVWSESFGTAPVPYDQTIAAKIEAEDKVETLNAMVADRSRQTGEKRQTRYFVVKVTTHREEQFRG